MNVALSPQEVRMAIAWNGSMGRKVPSSDPGLLRGPAGKFREFVRDGWSCFSRSCRHVLYLPVAGPLLLLWLKREGEGVGNVN